MSVRATPMLTDERVVANMVIASNGATSFNKDSAPLSPPADRERFHAIRGLSSALVVGGNTYRCEHYSKAPLPVFVATREPELLSSTRENEAPHSSFLNASPSEVVSRALSIQGAPILVEGGISFIKPLLEACTIDRLFLTRSPIAGDGDFFDFELLHRNYRLDKSEVVADVTFEEWTPLEILK
ncbi:MAG: dihydrofolate reductase family protein [Actinomycetota bacterium]